MVLNIFVIFDLVPYL